MSSPSALASDRRSARKPIGVLGGTFDPIHLAHLRLAEESADEVDLERVLIIPAAVPPHRALPNVTAADRLEMARLAIDGNPRLTLDDRECRRAGPSFTVDTLTELRAELGVERSLCLLLGLDAFLLLTTWSRWQHLFELAHLVLAQRPGFTFDAATLDPALAREVQHRWATHATDLQQAPAGLIWRHEITALDISATGIRQAIREGKSPRYLLPDSVLDYIHRNQLYKDLDGGSDTQAARRRGTG